MADNAFLKGLFEAFGGEIEPEITIRGVIEMAHQWLEGEAEEQTFWQTAEKVLQNSRPVAPAFEKHLDSVDEVDPEFRTHMLGVIDGYSQAVEILEALVERPQDTDHLVELIEQLTEVADETAPHFRAVNEWNESGSPVCPLCAYRTRTRETSCPDCEVQLLIHDPDPPDLPVVEVGQEFLDVYSACAGVATGGGKLEQLLKAIEVAGSSIHQTRTLLVQLKQEELVKLADHCLDGLERIATIETSCEVADLNRGWLQASEAAVQLAGYVAELQEMVE